ncbi:histidine phosphatase family protein [Peribacillus kribbensis]|uniref:histidine phosphatase family protein n=1 Tax=Peribacillus kribbensis TaxID=356658 RepID=UPI000425739B|nr:histidine phosphatase family protein [Peribacillus kribbensis]
MIFVIRHGQTNLNLEEKLQGREGLPLNGEGIRQAEKLREELRDISFHLVFSSPQKRAVQTAEIVTGRKAIIDSRIDVFDLGEADNLKVNEVIMDGYIPDPKVYKGMENRQRYLKRIFDFMRELERYYKEKNLNILLSGHRCTTGCIGAYFQGIPEDGNILRHSSNHGGYQVYDFKSMNSVKSIHPI